jgi:hypothetical protein
VKPQQQTGNESETLPAHDTIAQIHGTCGNRVLYIALESDMFTLNDDAHG